MNSRLRLLPALLCLVVSVGSIGAAPAPEDDRVDVDVERGSTIYISPNGDGVQDQLSIAPSIVSGQRRVPKAYELVVFGSEGTLAGEVVWYLSESESETRGFLGDLLGIGEEPVQAIPQTLTWDGTFLGSAHGADRTDVPDGAYIYQLSVTDDQGRTTKTPPLNVSVDRIAPQVISVSADAALLSPNGDGIGDVVEITQIVSYDATWTGTFASPDGTAIREFVWADPFVAGATDGIPTTLVWDGTAQTGAPVPDAAYSYRLVGRDLAGNATTSNDLGIVVSTTAGDVAFAWVDPVFSPNGDGVSDTLAMNPAVVRPEDVQDYTLTIASVSDRPVVYREIDLVALPETLIYDGTTTTGSVLDDGTYQVSLTARYINGTEAVSSPVEFQVDTEPPTGVMSAATWPTPTEVGAPLVFGGDGRSELRIEGSVSETLAWTAMVSDGATSWQFSVDSLIDSQGGISYTWDSHGSSGSHLDDGAYSLVLTATDSAGNTGSTNTVRAILDTRDPKISISLDVDRFSPDGDGVSDSVIVATDYEAGELIDEFLLSIADLRGRIIRTEYKRAPFASFEWLGRTNGSTIVPDGEYYATLEVRYYNGFAPTATAGPIHVDRTDPEVLALTAPYRLFSPDGDGERDQVTILQETSPEHLWRGVIISSSDQVVLERQWSGTATTFTWDGRDLDGDVVPDGDYIYQISSTDAAGNYGEEDLTLVVDTLSLPVSQQPPEASISAAPVPFTPDGDGTNDELIFALAVASPNPIASWQVEVTDTYGELVRRIRGTGTPPEQVAWNGRSSYGELVQSAQEYLATFTVTDEFGNEGDGATRFPVGILVLQEGLVLRIMIPSISFAPYTADLFEIAEQELQTNLETLRNLAEVLKRYPDRSILVEGHAAHDQYDDPEAMEREQTQELLPLSLARAEEVRRALIILGIDTDRMTTVGIGGARPIVPHSDRKNLWKNRRVEFILERR